MKKVGIIKTKVDNTSGFGNGTEKATREVQAAAKLKLMAKLEKILSMPQVNCSTITLIKLTPKSPTQKGTWLMLNISHRCKIYVAVRMP